EKEFEFPLLALIVSGGHTELVLMKAHGQYERIGETLDDAAGEAYDKVARILELPYPGEPQIDQLAKETAPGIDFPRAWLVAESFDYSFSVLEYSDITYLHKLELRCLVVDKSNITACFQVNVVEVLVVKTYQAAKKYGV